MQTRTGLRKQTGLGGSLRICFGILWRLVMDDFISFKENILKEVSKGKLFTVNYPLLIEHILREAKLYRVTVAELLDDKEPSYKDLHKTERFWKLIRAMCILQSFGDMRNHRYHGLFGAIIIEPPGAKWYQSCSLAKALYDEEAVITAPGTCSFRECVVMMTSKRAFCLDVAFVPGNPFYTDGRGANTMRLNYTNASSEMIEEGIKRIGELF